MTRVVGAPAPPGHHRDPRPRLAGNLRSRARFAGTRPASKSKRRPPRPGASTQDPGSDTTCSDAEGCQRSRTPTDFEQNSDGEYELLVVEGAPMPAIPVRDKYVSCRPVPGGMRLVLRREEQRSSLEVKGTLEELEEAVPEVDEDCLDDEGPWHSTKPVWRWRGGNGPNRRQPASQGRARGEFGQAAWPYGPRRMPLERPHSAQCAKEVHRKSPYTHARPASAKAALVTPQRPPSATRPSSAKAPKPPPRPSRQLRPASAPSARPPSRPPSGHPVNRPASARPASGRPSSARPASATRPPSATARPTSARPESEATWTRPTSGISETSAPADFTRKSRPQSAPVFQAKEASHFEEESIYSQAAGRSILFQQQDYLEKQLGENRSKLNQCFTTLMQNWVSSYQKSRLRARMACRPLFGEGSDATFTFPKQFAPVPPPLTKPKKRDLEEEMRQLEITLQGSASGEDEDEVRPLESVKTIAAGRRGALQMPLDAGQLDLTGTIGKKMSTASNAESKVGPVRTLAMTPAPSTVFHQMTMREPSVNGGGTEGTSVSGLDLSEASDFLSPVFGMMPKRDVLEKVFQRVADDGEVHKDVLAQSLELLGIRHIKTEWVVQILSTVTRYTTLSFEEFHVFVHAYIDLQSREYENAFFELDKDGSGTIEAEEIGNLLRSINVTPMEQVIAELTAEFDVDNSGDIGLEEFCGLLAVINEREGFSKSDYERFKHTFNVFTDEFGSLGTDAVLGMMSYLSYEMSPEVVQKLVVSVDVDQSGTLSFSEFLFFMRKVHEREVQRLEDELKRLTRQGASDREDLLTSLLRVLGYVPDQEAIRDAAADSNISLAGTVMPRRGSAQMITLPGRGSALDASDGKSLRLLTLGGQATTTQKVLTISEAHKFLQVYRTREGFTRVEAAELQVLFERYSQETEHEKRLSCLDAGRILSRLGYRATHNEHELLFAEVDIASAGDISLAEFLKLVRKYRQKDLDDIRASYLKLGIVGGAGAGPACQEGRQVMKQSMNFLGMPDPTDSMYTARSRTEKSPAQRMKDAEDQRYGVLQTAVARRNQLRVIAQQNYGFDASEAQGLRARFRDHDSDGSGTVQSSELRALCQDLLPEMATDPKYRPELIRLLREVDSSGEGKMNFTEFLALARDLEDAVRKEKARKEQQALEQLPFTRAQVKGFRELFVENDTDGKDLMGFPTVGSLLNSLVPLGDRRVQQLAELFQKHCGNFMTTPDMEEWTMDFPDFLKLMNAVLEGDFCGVKAKSAQIAADLERAKEKEKIRQKRNDAENAVGVLSTLSSSSGSVFDALAGPAGDSDSD